MMPHFIKFDGYIVGYNMIQEVQDYIMNRYQLVSDKDKDYDFEGNIKTIKDRYAHQMSMEDDITRNCDDLQEAYQRLKRWNVLSKKEGQRLRKDFPLLHYEEDMECLRIDKCI